MEATEAAERRASTIRGRQNAENTVIMDPSYTPLFPYRLLGSRHPLARKEFGCDDNKT
jgi:hypothetical protein